MQRQIESERLVKSLLGAFAGLWFLALLLGLALTVAAIYALVQVGQHFAG